MNQTNPNQQILTLSRFMKRYVLFLGALFLNLLSYAQGANQALIDITVQETGKAGNDLDNWTVNDASRVFYVAPGANGSGTSINDPMSMDQAFNANQVQGGDWYWVKAGDYGMKNYDLSNLDTDATRFNPIAWVGYRTTPGDIVSQPYGGFNTAPNTDGKHSNPMANLPTNSAGHHILDSSLMPTITGNQGNAPDYLDNDYAFESDGGEEGYIFKNFQVQFMAAGWFIKNPKYWLFDNVVSAHMGNFQDIEGQGGSNQELRGEGIQFEKNGPAGNNCVVKNSFFAQHAIKALSFSEGEYNLAVDVACYSDINNGNPQDYYFHTTGKYNQFRRVRAIRNINSRHSGHGICFNYGSEHNMSQDSYIYGTSFHFDASHACLSKDNVIVKEQDWCQYITNDPEGNNSLCYSGGGYAVMDDANHNMVDGGRYSGAGFLDSQKHSRPGHTNVESAGHNNTFKNAVITDIGDSVFSYGNWSGDTPAFDNLVFNNILEGATLMDVARPNSGLIFQNNDIVNVGQLWDGDDGNILNDDTCFINNKWVNSANAEQDAIANFCFTDDGDENGADLDTPPDPPSSGNRPVITLNGASVLELNVGDTYTPPGSSATDVEDGTVDVQVTGSINTNIAGTYYEYHNAIDSDGNSAQTVTRTIRVVGEDTGGGGTTNGNRFVGGQALFTAVMIDSIKNRIENGYRHPTKPNAFINDVAYLVSQSNAFFSNDDAGAWDNWSVSNGYINVSSTPMPARGVSDQIHYAGIRTFFQKQFADSSSVAETNANRVMNRLLEYSRSNIQTDGLVADDTHTTPYMFIALKMAKFIETYTLVEAISTMSSSDKAEIEAWFKEWNDFFKVVLRFSSEVAYGPNWENEEYVSTDYNFAVQNSSTRTNPIDGRTSTGAQQTGLNNIRAHMMGLIHTYGIYFNEQDSKDLSFAWYKMMVQLNHFSDGTTAEMIRSYNGNESLGLVYNMVNLTASIKAAITQKIAVVNGLDGADNADEYFDYLTSKGTDDYPGLSDYVGTSTSGGNKNLLLLFKNHLDYKRQHGGQGHSPQRRLNGDLMDGDAKMTHRPAAAIMDLFYNDDEIDAAIINDGNYGYTQSNLTSGANTGGYPHTLNGTWNSLYGMIYYVDIDGAFSVNSSGDSDDTGDSGDEEPDFESVGVNGISVTPLEVNISIGDDFQLSATITPQNATNKNVIWSSSNNSVVAVDEFGRLIGLSEGSAVITARSEDGGFQARSNVRVFPASNAPFQLFMINTESQSPIVTLLNGAQVSYGLLGTNTGIVASFESTASIVSVEFTLSGEINHEETQREDPYSLYGDGAGIISGREFSIGNYNLVVTVTYQDGSTITEVVAFEIIEGDGFIEDPGQVGGYNFTIAPNPAVSQVQLSFPFEASDLSMLTIYDISGRVVQNISTEGLFTNGNLMIFNVSDLRQGIYIVSSFATNYGSSTQKLIVQ